MGRLLTDGTFLYSWLASLEEKQQRAAAATFNEEDDSSSAPQSKHAATTWIHCSVGPTLTPGEEEAEEGKQVGSGPPYMISLLTSDIQSALSTPTTARI